MSAVHLIAVAGGSGSGKTTLARKLVAAFQEDRCAILSQDSYYIDQSHRFDKDGGAVNFDHPQALEFTLMAEHLQELKGGRSIEMPIYDFATHKRLERTQPFASRPYILVDGTLILSQPKLAALFDEALFLEVDEDTRFQRRLKRDTLERGRTPEGVRAQFIGQVKPMHDRFIEPSKAQCTLLVDGPRIRVQRKTATVLQSRLLEILEAPGFFTGRG